jgi:hypothetical protein
VRLPASKRYLKYVTILCGRYISDPIREPERRRASTAEAPPAFKPPPTRSSAFGKIELADRQHAALCARADAAIRYVPLGPRPATARKAAEDKAPFNPGGCE